MVYSNEITDSEGNVVFRCEFDDRFDFTQKDMFYLMHKIGLFIRRDKETDKLYKKYQRFID